MDQQIILAVDDSGNFLGYIPKEEGHKGMGRRHLAIAVLLENPQGQVLLQRRKHKIFDNIWDLTGATHPLHKPHPCHSGERSLDPRNDTKCRICNKEDADETLEEATKRCLKDEWGIRGIRGIRSTGVFNYFAKDGENCENEHCYLMVGRYDGEVLMDKKFGYEYKWVDKKEFLSDLQSNPQKYTPWAKEAEKLLDNP